MSQNTPTNTDAPDPEVVTRAKRRQFAAEYKLRILEEADNCTEPSQVGDLMTRNCSAFFTFAGGLVGQGACANPARRVSSQPLGRSSNLREDSQLRTLL